MHKTHSHRQVNSVDYLELEQTAVIQLMISVVSAFKVYIRTATKSHVTDLTGASCISQRKHDRKRSV